MTSTLVTASAALPGNPPAAGFAHAPEQDKLLDERRLSKLKWRCRRGLLENDLFIERFFTRYDAVLTERQADALDVLMDLSDNDLLDLLLGRKMPEGECAQPHVVTVLAQLRQPPATPLNPLL